MDTFGLGNLSMSDVTAYVSEFFGTGIVGDYMEIVIGVGVVTLVLGALARVVLK